MRFDCLILLQGQEHLPTTLLLSRRIGCLLANGMKETSVVSQANMMKYDGQACRFLWAEPAGEFNSRNIRPASLLPLNCKEKPYFSHVISFCLESRSKLCDTETIRMMCNEVSPVSCRQRAVTPEGLQ